MIGVEECIKEEFKSLHDCLRNSTEWMLQMVLKEKVFVEEEKERGETKQLERKSPIWKVCSQSSDVAAEESWR